MTPEREHLLARIRKVLALTESPNENEAAVAMQRVHTMLADHNMTMEDVRVQQSDIGYDLHGRTENKQWRCSLASNVGMLYFSLYFCSTDGKEVTHYFVGEKHNVAVARLMFDYISGAIERLAREATERQRNKHRSTLNYHDSFIDACALRVCGRIQERISAARAGDAVDWCGNNLPVLASEYDRKQLEAKAYMDQEFNFSEVAEKLPAPRANALNQQAAIAGFQAGESVGLEHQVGASTAKRLS